jgi:hypothetical protein
MCLPSEATIVQENPEARGAYSKSTAHSAKRDQSRSAMSTTALGRALLLLVASR